MPVDSPFVGDVTPRARVLLGCTFTHGSTAVVGGTQVEPKEWSVDDDILVLSDSLSFSIENDDGRYSGQFACGDGVVLHLSDSSVDGGAWKEQFRGRVTALDYTSDISGGSVIQVTCMDLGWHLVSTAGRPLQNIKSVKFSRLLELVLDTSWGFAGVRAQNDTNRRLKHGRTLILQVLNQVAGAPLSYIQIEPGQRVADILVLYAKREGMFVNVSADGYVQIFRPNYTDPALYNVRYHGSTEATRGQNNIVGRPRWSLKIDGLYTSVTCFSTVVQSQVDDMPDNPNEMYTRSTYTPTTAPLPFMRREVISDSEAISRSMRQQRAQWHYQRGIFDGDVYEVTFRGIAQGGAFYVSDTMCSVNDSVHRLNANRYVSAVRKSCTLSGGFTSTLRTHVPGTLGEAPLTR